MTKENKRIIQTAYLLLFSYLGFVKNKKGFRVLIILSEIFRFIASILIFKYKKKDFFDLICKEENRNNYLIILQDMLNTIIFISQGYLKMALFMAIQVGFGNYLSARALAGRLNDIDTIVSDENTADERIKLDSSFEFRQNKVDMDKAYDDRSAFDKAYDALHSEGAINV